jgi:TM2 domain-containing membrane protein YozV
MKGRTVTAMLLAYLVPGAGHLYLGRRMRAITFFLIVVLLFVIGVAIDGDLYMINHANGSMLRMLAALGSLGSGVIYWVAAWMGVHGDVTSITFEHGTAFTITAGLMNLLLVVDAFDIAQGRKE